MSPSERLLANIADRLRGRGRVLVFPEAADERTLEAAARIQAQDLARVIMVGNPDRKIPELTYVDPENDARLDQFAELYCHSRPRTKPKVARKIVAKPVFFAGMLVRSNAADAMVAGATMPTAKVIEASLLTVGLAPGIRTPSSAFLMLLPRPADPEARSSTRTLLFADCAVNIAPDEQQLADIAVASARTFRALTRETPRVAMLSFATHGSAKHPLVTKVSRATDLVRDADSALLVEGELQADAAIIQRVADAKVDRSSDVAGAANVLVFPSLEAGNIAYKLTQYLGQAQAVGPILQGFAKPLCDLSRGATAQDIVAAATLTLAQSLAS